jgi:hypothetical protein
MIVRLGRYREAKTACEKKRFFGASTDHQISACLSALPPRLLSAIPGREVADGGRQERSEPTAIRITAICWIGRGRSLPTPTTTRAWDLPWEVSEFFVAPIQSTGTTIVTLCHQHCIGNPAPMGAGLSLNVAINTKGACGSIRTPCDLGRDLTNPSRCFD